MVEKIIIALIVIVLLVICIGLYSQSKECKARSGMMVKTMTGYECIKATALLKDK